MSEFYNEIVENLKMEAKALNDKLKTIRSKEEFNIYISVLKSLRDTLNLIKEYDWQLMYSEYGVKTNQLDKMEKILNQYNESLFGDKNTYKNTFEIFDMIANLWNAPNLSQKAKSDIIDTMTELVTEIAIWEQNHEGKIRNHKVWTTNIPYNKKSITSKNIASSNKIYNKK